MLHKLLTKAIISQWFVVLKVVFFFCVQCLNLKEQDYNSCMDISNAKAIGTAYILLCIMYYSS